jgi:hypothetical protein
MLSGGLAFPTHPLHHRVLQFDSAFLPERTFHGTTSAVPAFIRIKYEGWFPFFRVGVKDVHDTDIYTPVATITDGFVKDQRFVRRDQIRGHIGFIVSHIRYVLLNIF